MHKDREMKGILRFKMAGKVSNKEIRKLLLDNLLKHKYTIQCESILSF